MGVGDDGGGIGMGMGLRWSLLESVADLEQGRLGMAVVFSWLDAIE